MRYDTLPKKPLVEAVEDVYASGQQLALKRIDLLVFEFRAVVLALALAALASLIALLGVLWLSYGTFLVLTHSISAPASAAVVGGLGLLLGSSIALVARRMWLALERPSPS